ncbi:MAG: phage portal protein [Phycisphaerae bacterium]|nr:phage portal protein [Phycisphaerae bacterium]
MAYTLEQFADVPLDEPLLRHLLDEHERAELPRLNLLWSYYRNHMETVGRARRGWSAKPYRLAQERGLPGRLAWLSGGGGAPAPSSLAAPGDVPLDDRAAWRRELVIENDIAWRIHAMIDFMFGKPLRFAARDADAPRRALVERVLEAAWEASGGVALLQDLALLGHVYGHVDLLVRADPAAAIDHHDDPVAAARAGSARVEVVEPTRGVALLSGRDFRSLDAYIVRSQREGNAVSDAPASPVAAWVSRWLHGHAADATPRSQRERVRVTEVLSARYRQLYEERLVRGEWAGPVLIDESENTVSPGRVPVVHIQNVSQPFRYAGLGEVEPLIPLQDELNTRLTDRASRVTLQSFKMFLAKGLGAAGPLAVGPGQVWTTENPDAQVLPFGGDSAAPGEEIHIDEVRQALDKASAVPPLASGVLSTKIGNLTSENALRVTLQGMLSRTSRKRVCYGRGLAEAGGLLLAALDAAGVFRTTRDERRIEVVWPDPLPRDARTELDAARLKLELGLPAPRVLEELGYSGPDAGVI